MVHSLEEDDKMFSFCNDCSFFVSSNEFLGLEKNCFYFDGGEPPQFLGHHQLGWRVERIILWTISVQSNYTVSNYNQLFIMVIHIIGTFVIIFLVQLDCSE